MRLDETIAQNQRYYMTALQDILTITESTTGYFSTVFCNAFFANQAALNALSVQIIELRGDGVIKSEDYTAGEEGLLIDAAGNIDANQNTHIGGNCVIDGNAMYYGDISITGEAFLKGRTVIEGDAHFSGDIDSGPLELKSDTPVVKVVTYNNGDTLNDGMNVEEVIGTFKGYSFKSFSTKYEDIGQGYFRHSIRIVKMDNYVERFYYNSSSNRSFTIDSTLTYTYESVAGAKTFKLKNLPTYVPQDPNIVYKDSNGFLKIS